MLAVLVAERLLTRQGHLTRKGQVARHIFNPWELAVTEFLLGDALGRLEPAEVVEVLSLFIPSKVGAAVPPPLHSELRGRRDPLPGSTPRDEVVQVIAQTIARVRGREA